MIRSCLKSLLDETAPVTRKSQFSLLIRFRRAGLLMFPTTCSWDAEGHFPVDKLRAAAELGFGGIYVKDDVGGCGMGRLDAAVVFEALAYGDVSVTAYLTIHNMVCGIIDKYGTEEQRRQYLPDLVAMKTLASYCLTEPGTCAPFICCFDISTTLPPPPSSTPGSKGIARPSTQAPGAMQRPCG